MCVCIQLLGERYYIRYLLVKLLKHNQHYCSYTLRFDVYQRPSSEEAGTQFFRFLTQREDAVSQCQESGRIICVAQLV